MRDRSLIIAGGRGGWVMTEKKVGDLKFLSTLKRGYPGVLLICGGGRSLEILLYCFILQEGLFNVCYFSRIV